jgi:hypothetical protein
MEFIQDVMPQGQGVYNTIDRATPENFGGQVGQALDQTGNMLAQHAVERQKIINAANVDDVYANQFDPAFRQKFMDFLKLKGKDAEAAFPQFQQDMHDLLSQTAQSLPNALQQHTFEEIARRRMSLDLDSMARHAASETNNWVNQTADATGGVYMDRIVDNRNDPNKVQGYVNNINRIYSIRGQELGQNEVTYKAQAANVINAGIAKAVQADLDRDDPESAQNTLNNYGGYLSNTGLKDGLQSKITPRLEAHQINAVTTDLESRFNPNDPNVNRNDAAAFMRDPANYPQIGEQQRTTVLNNWLGDHNSAVQVRQATQATADNNFIDAINKNQIWNASQFNEWKDPTSGYPASPKLVQSAIERSLRPSKANTEENRQTLVDLSDAVSNRGLTDPAPINQAFLDGKINQANRQALLGLQDKMQHPEKDPWFKQAESMYKDRYGAANADAHALYPQFINNLQQNIQEQNLKGHQIYEMAQKMLNDVDVGIVSHWFGPDTTKTQPSLDFAKQWGGFPKPDMRSEPQTASATNIQRVPDHEGTPSPIEPEAEAWVRRELGATSTLHVTPDNVRVRYEQLKAADPQFWKHWKIGE